MGDDLGLFQKVLESGARIRLAPGVIGKSSMIAIGAIVAWIAVIWKLSPTAPWWFNALLVGAAGTATLYAMHETRNMREYSATNPLTALMEGADITEFRRIEAQAKGLPTPDKSPPIQGPPGRPLILPPEADEPQI